MLPILGIAGLWMLLFGMNLMKTGLENTAQAKLRIALKRLAGSPLKAGISGLVATMLVQSSTAVSVLSVGFVNAGIMNLRQAIGILLGANVGTCITVQIISFNFTAIAALTGLIGLLLWLRGKNSSLYNLGRALSGFGLIFCGLKLLSVSFTPLQNASWFLDYLYSLSSNPILAVAAGTLGSALLHSSAAATGIVMLLSGQGMLPLPAAVALVLGNNIGTCITAVVASLAGSTAGKRVALAHVFLNIAGAALFLPLLGAFTSLVALTADSLSRQVANAHTLFNIISSVIAFPFIYPLGKLMELLVRDTGRKK
ncbi:MAG: Na/Pi cotransporter family protein [Firmicutes bacterium]|nr:Na/Pi cotransporter family protein [Bacillota bacterium]